MHMLARTCLLVALLASTMIGCRDAMESMTDPSFTRFQPGPSFDWAMPARFGQDRDGDGLTDYLRMPEEINPTTWTVNFNACEMEPGTKYQWHVNQRHVASVESCQYVHEFPAEGTYDVAVHVVRKSSPGSWAEQLVTVQDWLIVSFGDSYASGQGVAEITQANDALFVALDATLQDLVDARRHLDQVLANLQEAFENKGLAESILATQQQRFNNFLAACTIEDFKSIAECAQFLADLPFDTYETARAHFQQGVDDARERVESLTQAFNEAQAAVVAAQNAIANLQTAIAALQAGFTPVRWQAAYANENWDGEDCNRSARAAPARAALALEQSDPRTSVTFVHLACTGAKVDANRAQLRQQIPWAAELIGPREIDAVLLSIGGNDAGFANIATACAIQQPCYSNTPAFDPAAARPLCSLLGVFGYEAKCNETFEIFPDRSANELLAEGVAGLPAKYAEVAGVLFPTLSGLVEPDAADRVRSSRVYITEYVDMTKDDSRAYCRLELANLLGAMPGMTVDEMEWLDVVAGRSINRAVADAAVAHGWTLVSQIYDAYAPHGYCADDHWVVRIHESFLLQGTYLGSAHPNVPGHTLNGQAIFAALMPDLYPMGMGGAPRAPDQPFAPGPFTASGGPMPQ